MRERATTHSLVEDGHQEHVTIFEIGLHFGNGLNPMEKYRDKFMVFSEVTSFYTRFLLPGSKSSLPSVREDEDQVEHLHDGFLNKTDLRERGCELEERQKDRKERRKEKMADVTVVFTLILIAVTKTKKLWFDDLLCKCKTNFCLTEKKIFLGTHDSNYLSTF